MIKIDSIPSSGFVTYQLMEPESSVTREHHTPNWLIIILLSIIVIALSTLRVLEEATKSARRRHQEEAYTDIEDFIKDSTK